MSSETHTSVQEQSDYIYQRLRHQISSLGSASGHIFFVFGASVGFIVTALIVYSSNVSTRLGRFSQEENLSYALVGKRIHRVCLSQHVRFVCRVRWLYRDGFLPEDIHFIGYSRSQLTVEKIFANANRYMKVNDVH
jgi:hypothetical protein